MDVEDPVHAHQLEQRPHRLRHRAQLQVAAAGLVTYLLHGQGLLALALGGALVVNFLVAALVGSLIPLTLRWLRADPAVASSVFVTACTDLCGFFSFLGLLSAGMRYFA